MLEVQVKKNNVEFALRLLKRKIKDSGLMVELRERQYYKNHHKKSPKKESWVRFVIGFDNMNGIQIGVENHQQQDLKKN